MALRDKPTIEGEELADLCEELATGLDTAPLSEPLHVCAGIQQEGFGRNFNATRSEAGTPWPPHAPATIRMYGPHPLLVLSGEMKQQSTTNQPLVADREVAVVIDLPYAAVQNFGGGNIPAREFLYVDQPALELCEERLMDFIEERIL